MGQNIRFLALIPYGTNEDSDTHAHSYSFEEPLLLESIEVDQRLRPKNMVALALLGSCAHMFKELFCLF